MLKRKAYEKILGVKLKPHERVHHKDLNNENDDKSNLQILTKKEHDILHFKGRNAMYKYRKKQEKTCDCGFKFSGPGEFRNSKAFVTKEGRSGVICPKCKKKYIVN